MLALLSLLQARRDWPGHVLAERLEVTPRTVRRDVDRLRTLGYAIVSVKGPDGGYRLAAGTDLPPLLFDDEQAVAIAVGLRFAAVSGVDVGDAAERALATVRQVMPSRLRHRIDAIEFTSPTVAVHVAPDVVEVISRAVRARRTLRFDYGDGEGPSRSVEPHGIVVRNTRWYLVAWDLDRQDWRIFRLDRMTPRSTAGLPFTPRAIPADDPAAFVAARAKGSDDVDRWPCVGTFEIGLPPRMLVDWIHDGQIEEASPGTSLVTTGSWSWTGLVATVIRFDAPFRIIAPTELIAEARRVAELLHTTPAEVTGRLRSTSRRP